MIHPDPSEERYLLIKDVPLREEMDVVTKAAFRHFCNHHHKNDKNEKNKKNKKNKNSTSGHGNTGTCPAGPPKRAVVLFSYGTGFKGPGAVFASQRAGAGFIAPELRLEVDPSTTPPAFHRDVEGRGRVWPGWTHVRGQEDLRSRWEQAGNERLGQVRIKT